MNPDLDFTQDPSEAIGRLRAVLRRHRLLSNDEDQLQRQIAQVLDVACLRYDREKSLSLAERVDFYLPESGVAVEVKMRMSASAVLRQLKRYADLPGVTAVVLIARRPIVLPATLSGKPVASLSIWQSLIA